VQGLGSGEAQTRDWGSGILAASIEQILALALLSGFSESEPLLAIWLYAFCGFWIAVIVIALRRGKTPTGFDMAFVRIGFLVLLLVSMFVSAFVWYLRGRS
jgi:hypothetical protein